MSVSIRTLSRFAAIGVATIVMAAGTAEAGGGLSIELSINGGAATVFNPAGNDLGSGLFNYTGTEFGGGEYVLSWDINAQGTTPIPGDFVSGNIVIQNTTLATQTYSITILLPVSPAVLPSSLIGGSVAGGLTTDLDGGTLSDAGGPVWSALIDGNVVATLLDNPFSVGKAGAGSVAIPAESFGQPIPSLAGPAVESTIAINLTFSLTAGDSASFTSVFVVQAIPAPAGLALLGLAGAFGGRRRRA